MSARSAPRSRRRWPTRPRTSPATDKAAWIEHCAVGLMAEALARAPVAPTPEPDDPFGQLTEAEQYALIHPRRAALIRSVGGLPDRCDFGPPAPDLVEAIVTGTSPNLRALDMQAVA